MAVIMEKNERLMGSQELEEREGKLMKTIEGRKKTVVVSSSREERNDSR